METLGEFIPSSSTKLLLHLNGNSTDSSGNGNNGTDTNITYSQANGKFGQGAGFTAVSNSKITMPSSIIQGAKTVSLWVNHTQNTFFRYIDNSSVFNQNGFNIFHGGTSPNFELVTEMHQSSSPIFVLRQQPTSISDGKWHNIIHTWDGTTGTNSAKMYLDGVLVAQATPSREEDNAPERALTLGEYNSQYDYNGAIDEVIVENRAWSAEEIKKYYTMTKGYYATL